jgi:HK97 gp10 family phage protein
MATKIQNRDRLFAKLRKLRTQTAPEMVKAITQASELVVAAQKHLVPVKTGALRDSIQWTFGTPPAYATFKGKKTENETRAVISAGNSAVRYAHLVEFGHQGKGARPFFYPGYRAVKKRAKAIINKAVKTAVKRAVT